MKDINKQIHPFGADLHVLNHFAKQEPKGKVIQKGLKIDFPNKIQPKNTQLSKEQSEAISFVFEQSPEIKELFKGDKILYQQYLNSIFPDSKVKDIVYHGTYQDFEGFDKEKLGDTTGKGKWVNKKTDEEFHYDSTFAFFFTDNKLNASAYSYKGRANKINEVIYHLESIAHPLYKEKTRVEESIKFLKTIPYYNDKINELKKEGKNNKEIQEFFKEEWGKIYKKTRDSSFDRFTNWQVNNNDDKNVANNFLNNIDKFLEGNPNIQNRFGNFLEYSSGIGDKINVWYDKDKQQYTFFDSKTKERFTNKEVTRERLVNFFNNGLKYLKESEEQRISEMKSLGYVEKIKAAVINLKNPSIHDYEKSPFPDKYKGTEDETSYIAAKQVKDAIKEGKDGVIYENVIDPLESNSYGVFNTENIHTLGSKFDIQQAKQFLSKEVKENKSAIDKTLSKVNIWAGSNENTILSNLAVRPFAFQGDEFKSVEEYFQLQKANYLKEELYKDGNEAELEKVVKHNNKIADEIVKNENNPFKIKQLGRQFIGLDIKAWDKNALSEMEKVLKVSFEQNPKALQALLTTKNAELTHIQDTGRWKKDFPELLMKVRNELSKEVQLTSTQEPIKEDSPNIIKPEGKPEIDITDEDNC